VRDAFVRRLLALAHKDPRIVLITGDLGFGVLDAFERELPKQYLNAGVAEQNMTALATGMALEGFVPFTYSIGNFCTLRCLEQLRNDAFYHEASVKVVCVGGGFTYGSLGMSHHATEDLSILRALPNVCVMAPSNDYETELAVDEVVKRPGSFYLRLERVADASLDPGSSVPFEFGRARCVRPGNDVTLIATGGIVTEALRSAGQLQAAGVSARVLSMHTIKPFDSEAVLAAARETRGIVTIEENSVIGGLGGAVAETCLEGGAAPRRFARLGMRDEYSKIVGDQAFLRSKYHMDAAAITATALRLLGS
jgi:transketolase